MELNYYLIGFLVFVLPFAFISIWQDIKTRKVKNIINLPFFYLSFLIFVFFLRDYDGWFLLAILASCSFAYWFYYKSYWGGADGKIFISLTMLILALGNEYYYVNWILNLLFIYVISIIFLVLFRTSLEKKIKVLKATDFNMYIFQILLVFIFLKNLIRNFAFSNPFYSALFLIILIIGFRYLTPYLRKYFDGFSLNKKISLNIILFIIFIGMSYLHLNVVWYFLFILIFRISADFVSNMTILLKNNKGEKYYSPFAVYLFISAILTMIISNNLIEYGIELFKYLKLFFF